MTKRCTQRFTLYVHFWDSSLHPRLCHPGQTHQKYPRGFHLLSSRNQPIILTRISQISQKARRFARACRRSPSVFSRMAHTSVSACDLRDSRDSREIQSFVREDSGASALWRSLLRDASHSFSMTNKMIRERVCRNHDTPSLGYLICNKITSPGTSCRS